MASITFWLVNIRNVTADLGDANHDGLSVQPLRLACHAVASAKAGEHSKTYRGLRGCKRMSFGSPRPSGLTVVACFARSVHAAPFALGRKQAAARSDSVQKLFDRSQWREGFDDACKTLENTARKYFQTGCDRGRIKLIRRGKQSFPHALQ